MAEKIINILPGTPEIKTRLGQNAPLTAVEMDGNLNNIVDALNLVSGSISAVSSSLSIASVNTSGTSGTSGQDGTQGISGTDGTSGTGGTSGTDGTGGSSGTSGITGGGGSAGTSGTGGTSGTSGVNGFPGTDGTNGSAGTSGTNGLPGGNGTDGTSGTGGTSGTTGTAGSSGINGTNGTDGTGGTSGTSGLTLPPGTSGTSGVDGTGAGGGTGIFVTGSAGYDFFETTSSLKITGSLAVLGSITASGYAITGGGGDPILTSAGNIILSASIASAVQIKGAPLRLPQFADAQTSSLAPSKGDLYFNTTTDTFYIYDGSSWETVGSGGGGGVSSYTQLTDIPTGIISSSAQIARLGADIISSSAQVDAAILAGSISNSQLENSSLTISGVTVSLGSDLSNLNTGLISSSQQITNLGFNSGSAISAADVNNFTAIQNFIADVNLSGSVVIGHRDVTNNADVGGLTSTGYSLVLQETGSKMRIGPYYSAGADRDYLDIKSSVGEVEIQTNTSVFRIENANYITSSIEMVSGSVRVSGSLLVSGSATINLGSGSNSVNQHFTIARTIDPTLREFDLKVGYGPTGSYYIGSNLYYDATGTFVKDRDSVSGWKINFVNTDSSTSDELSFDYQAPNSNENTSSIFVINQGPFGFRAQINGDLELNNYEVTAATGSFGRVDLISDGTLDAGTIDTQDLIVSQSLVFNVFGGSSFLSASFADDTAAAAGGVPIGGIYRNGNVILIRIS